MTTCAKCGKELGFLERIRQEHRRAYENWANEEDTKLISEFREGLTIGQLSEKHERQIGRFVQDWSSWD